MKLVTWILSCFAWVCLLVSCARPVDAAKQKEARTGLDSAVAQIPNLPDFTIIKVVYEEFYDDIAEPAPVCYYARAYLVIGSSLPETKASDTYAERLQALGLGWEARKDPYSLTIMSRGNNERAAVSLAEPGAVVRDGVDITQLKKQYPSIIFLQLDYIVPNEKGC